MDSIHVMNDMSKIRQKRSPTLVRIASCMGVSDAIVAVASRRLGNSSAGNDVRISVAGAKPATVVRRNINAALWYRGPDGASDWHDSRTAEEVSVLRYKIPCE